MGVYSKIKAVTLGADLPSKLKILFYTWSVVKRRLPDKVDIDIKLKKFGRECRFKFMDDDDISAFKEIFLEEIYAFDLKGTPNIILDLGSNSGLSVIYFKLKYPDARIYAFEPAPGAFEKLKDNTRQFDDVFIYNYAVCGKDGKTRFHISPRSSLSSSLKNRNEGQTFLEVEGKKLDTMLEELSIDSVDLVKFDIEGAEMEVFKNFKNFSRVKNFLGELHPDLIGATEEEFLELFKGFKTGKGKEIRPNRYEFFASREGGR